MAAGQSLEQTQRLQQRLSPLQVRLMRVLEMTTPEVEAMVRDELNDNPALERTDSNPEESERQDDHQEPSRLDEDGIRAEDSYDDPDTLPLTLIRPPRVQAAPYYAQEDPPTLTDYLESQLGQLPLDDTRRGIAHYIIGNLDSNGRLTRTLPQLEEELNQTAPVSREQVREAWNMVRDLDPAGVCHMDLRDCLLLQLRRLPASADVKLAQQILSHYYDLYAGKHYDRLEAAMGVGVSALRRADVVITGLNPKPGAPFGGGRMEEAAATIVADYEVDVDDLSDPSNPQITVSLASRVPELKVSQTFGLETLPKNTKPDVRAFVRHHHDRAMATVRLMEMRQNTMLKAIHAIVQLQRDFFLTDDVSRIRPMVLRDVEALTGQDLSVISRATSGKYVATRAGVYPMRLLFAERTVNAGEGKNQDEEFSAASLNALLEAMRSIIKTEDPAHPLSDETIRTELNKRGYSIARRTVAKYREDKLALPVARLRKKI